MVVEVAVLILVFGIMAAAGTTAEEAVVAEDIGVVSAQEKEEVALVVAATVQEVEVTAEEQVPGAAEATEDSNEDDIYLYPKPKFLFLVYFFNH